MVLLTGGRLPGEPNEETTGDLGDGRTVDVFTALVGVFTAEDVTLLRGGDEDESGRPLRVVCPVDVGELGDLVTLPLSAELTGLTDVAVVLWVGCAFSTFFAALLAARCSFLESVNILRGSDILGRFAENDLAILKIRRKYKAYMYLMVLCCLPEVIDPYELLKHHQSTQALCRDC